jgi:hypothetical protein
LIDLCVLAADCDNDHHLVVPKVRERMMLSKQRMHRYLNERFSPEKLTEVQGKKQYCDEISTKSAALENLDNEVDIIRNSAWEPIRENITTSYKESLGYYELKEHKP